MERFSRFERQNHERFLRHLELVSQTWKEPFQKLICFAYFRFDMTQFTLANAAVQTLGTQATVPVTAAAKGWAGGPGAQEVFGHCRVDTFQITGISGSTPIICGPASGQHRTVVFRTLLHASTKSQTIPDIHRYSQILTID